MKRGTLPVFTLFLTFCCFAIGSAAETAGGIVPGQPLAVFVDKYLAANGGVDKLQNIHSMRIEAVRTVKDGSCGNLVYLSRFPNLERSVWHGPRNFEFKRGFDGKRSWSYSCTFDGKAALNMSSARQPALFDWTILDPNRCGASLELLPSETVGSVPCYRVKATFASGAVRDFWFETATLRLVKTVDTAVGGGQRFFVIDRSIKVDGVWYPQVMREVDSNGVELERIVFMDVQTNIALLPSFAEPPNYPYGVESKN
jgi:hypothetical protein